MIKMANPDITEMETELSLLNSKTLDLDKYVQFLEKKKEFEPCLNNFYSMDKFRHFRMKTYIGKQKSEAKMINNFSQQMGTKDEVIIGYGNWSPQKQMKHQEQSMTTGLRNIFRRAGFSLINIDEYNTRKKCYNCEGEL